MEEKIESNYYAPDFDPKKVPRKLQKAIKNKRFAKTHEERFEISNHMQIRTMAPFNMRCNGCGYYTNKGTKIQSNVDKFPDYMYMNRLTIWRFHIRCVNCKGVMVFRTDPENKDYAMISGGTRSFRSAYDRARQEQADEAATKEVEDNNPMKLLEDRTFASKRELEEVELLEDLQDLRTKPSQTDAGDLLTKKHTNEVDRAKALILEREQTDEAEIKDMLIKQNTVELKDEDGGDMDTLKPKLSIRVTETGMESTDNSSKKVSLKNSENSKSSSSVMSKKVSSLGIKRKPGMVFVKPKAPLVKKAKLPGLCAYSDSESDSD